MFTQLDSLISKATKHYSELLGFSPKRTNLQLLNQESWDCFCRKYNLNHNSEGVFLIRNLTAYLLENSKNLELNLFHEYFGHGLFCEYSKQGKFIELLENKTKKEERIHFKGRDFSLDELIQFRKQNPLSIILQKSNEKNLAAYELFAIWTEKYLSEKLGINKFEKKYSELPKNINEGLNYFLEFQKNYGELVLMYEVGMPKYYNKDKIKSLLQRLFKDKANTIQMALLYGSRKPYSDIDILIVSKEITNFNNDWLDIYALQPEQFEYALSMFDISITDPLLTGEFILGDNNYFNQKKQQLEKQPITQEAIYYNIIKAKEQRILSKNFPNNSKENSRGESYFHTYLKNAIALKQGKRILAKKGIL